MRTRSLSLGWRLSLALVGVSIFTLLVVGFVFYAFIGRFVMERQERQLVTKAAEAAEQVSALFPDPGATVDQKALNSLIKTELKGLPASAGVVVFRAGAVVAKAGTIPQKAAGLALLRLEANRLAAQGTGAAVFKRILDLRPGDRVIVAAAPVASSGAKTVVAFVLPTANAFDDRGSLLKLLLVAGAVAVAVALALGLGVGRWMSKPVRRLASSAAGMAGGSYDDPVPGGYPGELNELAGNLETMRREVKRSDESLRAFVGSAAHELRTPLTSIQGFSQALLDGTASTPEQQQRAAAAVYRESARLQRLVDALLMLSRYDSREFQPSYAAVDAARVVREEIERLEQAGLAPAGRILLDAPGPATIVTDEDMLRRIAANLLRNAVQYGGEEPVGVVLRAVRPAQGSHPPAHVSGHTSARAEAHVAGHAPGPVSAHVLGAGPGLASAQASSTGGPPVSGLLLEVSNGGPPLTSEERERIFDRFYRGGGAQRADGLGLGLALVREICRVLGGSVGLVGQGPRTVLRVDLPSAGIR
jgi:signal transduction histidine kinase